MTELHQYLQDFSGRPFVRGVSDCCALAAGWIAIRSGKPVDHPFLGAELSDVEAAAIVQRIGGILPAARAVLREHGWRQRQGEPQDGDVIIAERHQLLSPTLLGILSAGKVVTTSRTGMRIFPLADLMELEAWYHGD